MKSASATFS